MPKRFFANRRTKKQKAAAVAPMLAATDLGNGVAEIIMYGDVVENEPRDWWTGEPTGELAISAQRILDEIDNVRDADHIIIRLNSGGGDLFSGVAIHNALKDLPAKKTIHIDGLAASAASVIACAGDEVIVRPGSMMMIHEGYVSMFGWYTPDEVEQVRNQCDATVKAMTAVYTAKTGRGEDEIAELVSAETWFVGQEIIDAGFADTMADADTTDDDTDAEDGEVVYDAARQTLTVAGIRHDASLFKNLPDAAKYAAAHGLHAASIAHAADAYLQAPPTAAESEGEAFMNADELRTSHPELVAEIEQQAQAAERERMQAIDEIASSIPSDLVATAKYTEPMTAAELALASVKAGNAQAASFMAALEDDEEDSGADEVDSEPNGGNDESTESEEDKEAAAAIAAAAAIVNTRTARKAN